MAEAGAGAVEAAEADEEAEADEADAGEDEPSMSSRRSSES